MVKYGMYIRLIGKFDKRKMTLAVIVTILVMILLAGVYLTIVKEYTWIKRDRFIETPKPLYNDENANSWIDTVIYSLNLYKEDLRNTLEQSFTKPNLNLFQNQGDEMPCDRANVLMSTLNLEGCLQYPSFLFKHNTVNTAWDKTVHHASLVNKLSTICPMWDQIVIQMNVYRCFPDVYDTNKVMNVLDAVCAGKSDAVINICDNHRCSRGIKLCARL